MAKHKVGFQKGNGYRFRKGNIPLNTSAQTPKTHKSSKKVPKTNTSAAVDGSTTGGVTILLRRTSMVTRSACCRRNGPSGGYSWPVTTR